MNRLTTFALLTLAGLLAPAAAHADPYCNEEALKRGLQFGTPEFQEAQRACRERRSAEARSGAMGQHVQSVTLCKSELNDRGFIPGLGRYQAEMTKCMQRRTSEGKTGGDDFTGDSPFGRGKVQDYLNALYNDKADERRALEAEMGAATQTGASTTMLMQIARNYLGAYPVIYRACLEPDAPTVTLGEVYDEVKRDGTGLERGRRTVDTRTAFPVNRRFMPVVNRFGVGRGGMAEDLVAKLAGRELGELSFSNIARVVEASMHRRPCSDPVMQRFEAGLIKAATQTAAR
jgi:hypothetical protein